MTSTTTSRVSATDNTGWARIRNAGFTIDEAGEIVYALRCRIANLRENIATLRSQPDLACSTATFLRQAEMAYYKCGGSDRQLWPAVYR